MDDAVGREVLDGVEEHVGRLARAGLRVVVRRLGDDALEELAALHELEDHEHLGRKRVRNVQLWRLISRSISTRFGYFLDERSSLGALSKRGCFFRNARARNTHVEANLNHSFPALMSTSLGNIAMP